MPKHKKRGSARPQGMNLLQRMEQKNELKYKIAFWEKMDVLQQMCIDAAFMAANDVFQMGPGRCEQFGLAIVGYLNEICSMMIEDGKSDKDLVYTQEKIDQRLKKICGEKFQPWEERYGSKKGTKSAGGNA